jgi:hypothetical protein
MKHICAKITLVLLIFLFSSPWARSQNAPITTCGNASMGAPGNFSIPVTVTGFTNIGAISLTLEYDYAVAQYLSFTPNPQLSNFAVGDADMGNGFHRISMGWFGSGKTLPDGSSIITITFNYTSGNTTLSWYDDGPSCEYADGSYNVLNDIPTSTYYINGSVCALLGAPGPINGDDAVCAGVQGIVYSISQVVNATGYTWTVPPGAIITSGQGTNSIYVDYPLNATSGFVSVVAFNICGTGPATQLAVTVNPLPVADAGEDQSINYGTSTTLHAASGGAGTYSYHWSPEALLTDPDVQDPQTVILTSTTLFTLLVTDLASGCQKSDEVIVSVTGGPLGANPVAIPAGICSGGSSHLFANAGGGSGNYTYLWTCIPPGSPAWTSTLPDPVVTPDSSRLYQVQVNDGFTTTSGQTPLLVHQLPTAAISGGDTVCGIGNTTILQVDLTGTPPWNFTYAFGNTSVFVYNQTVTPYYIIAGETGTYKITYIEDAHCTGTFSGEAEVYIFPEPATPEVNYSDLVLHSSACCGNQWYLDNEPIPGATSQSYTVIVSGLYYDIVTLFGCSSDTSEQIDVIVGIDETVNSSFSIYPNPANDRVNVRCDGQAGGILQVRVFSATGILLTEQVYKVPVKDISLDLKQLPDGICFISILSRSEQIIRKLVIHN